jgi:hypothetical protein
MYLSAVTGTGRISFTKDDIDRQRINWLQKGVGCEGGKNI